MIMTAGSLSTANWISSWPPLSNKMAVTNHTSDGGFGALQSLEISLSNGAESASMARRRIRCSSVLVFTSWGG